MEQQNTENGPENCVSASGFQPFQASCRQMGYAGLEKLTISENTDDRSEHMEPR